MTRHRQAAPMMAAAAVMIIALTTIPRLRADEDDDDKPITSSAARVSRDTEGEVLIAIGAAAQKEAGLTTEILKPVAWPRQARGYGFVLDPAPLAALDSALWAARAALDASGAQYRRTRRLYGEQHNASLRDLQSAQAAYLTDRSRRDALQQQLRGQWGNAIAGMNPAARTALVNVLIERRAAIARVTAPVGEPIDSAPGGAKLFVIGYEDRPLDARAVYDAPMVVPAMQGQTFLVLVDAADYPIRPGTAVSAALPVSAATAHGVMIPRGAVVRYAGGDWVYQGLGGDRFVRRQITPAALTGAGYFVSAGPAPGARIVVTGAQTLLSEELKAQIRIED